MLKCPQCGETDHLTVLALVECRVFQRNGEITGSEPINGDHEWDDASPMTCKTCHHRGTVLEFDDEARVADPAQVRTLRAPVALTARPCAVFGEIAKNPDGRVEPVDGREVLQVLTDSLREYLGGILKEAVFDGQVVAMEPEALHGLLKWLRERGFSVVS